MEYIIEFKEKHSESALALVGYLRGLGIVVDDAYGVKRPVEGVAYIVASLTTQSQWDVVQRYPGVIMFMPKVVAEAWDPLSGCEDEYHDPCGPLEGCEEPGDPDD